MVAAFAPGEVLDGKYLVTRLIGQGGLGMVVAATHQQLGQKVAIKHLKATSLANPILVERFQREARLAAQVTSDHVARIYDVETTELGCPYIVMEYLEGSDLADILAAEGRVGVERALDYVLQACEALAEAHAFGIVHRDLKPENLFLARRAGGKEVLKILDFGISKLAEKSRGSVRESKLTSEKETFGTPNYMSPEQLQSASDVDARADIWGLGIILYELLSGRLPFEGDLPHLCLAIVNDPAAPLLPLCPDLPAPLEATILRCLEKNRTKRFSNVGELAQELAPYAPAASLARVEHVRQVVLESGEAVRPSARLPFPARARDALTSVSNERVPRTGRRRTTIALLVGLGFAAGFAGLLALLPARSTGASQAPVPSAETAVATATHPAAPPKEPWMRVPTAAPTAEPTPAAIAPPDPPVATTNPRPPEPPPTANAGASPARRAPAVAPPPTAPPAPPAPSPATVTAKKHAEFGDRQ
jgi:serine/threonine protein kinase